MPAVAAERGIQGMKFTAHVEVVESMGSELYVYFDVKAAAHSGELDDLAADAGLSELPGQGGESTHVVARLDATSSAAAGKDIELVLDTNGIKLFDPNGGNNLSAGEQSAAALGELQLRRRRPEACIGGPGRRLRCETRRLPSSRRAAGWAP